MKISINSDQPAQRLDQLPVGSEGTLAAPDHTTPTILRLMEMGMTAGARVRVTRTAPFGDPIEVMVRGTRLCLRAADARVFALADARPAAGDTP